MVITIKERRIKIMPRCSDKKDFTGYIVMENDTTYGEVTNIEVVKDDYLFYLKYDAILQSVNRENRNHNWYSGDAIVGALSAPNTVELIEKGKALGEAGHPVDGSVKRIATVDPKFTCHRVMKWWLDGDLIRAHMETLDDGLYGTKLTKMILQGMQSSYSFRGFAKMQSDKRHPGVKMILTPPQYVAYDEVVLPSHPEAYQEKGKTVVKKNIYNGTEKSVRLENAYPIGDMSIAITPSFISEMVRNSSENLDILCESFDIDPNQYISVSKDGKSAAIHTPRERFVFGLEAELAREAANAWKIL